INAFKCLFQYLHIPLAMARQLMLALEKTLLQPFIGCHRLAPVSIRILALLSTISFLRMRANRWKSGEANTIHVRSNCIQKKRSDQLRSERLIYEFINLLRL